MAWIFLIGAIISETSSTLSLKVAAEGKKSFYAVVVVGYVLAFALMTLSLAHGMPLGVAYGVWVAAGVALAALFSKLLFGEPLTPLMLGGIAMIMGGVLLVEIGAAH